MKRVMPGFRAGLCVVLSMQLGFSGGVWAAMVSQSSSPSDEPGTGSVEIDVQVP